MGIYENTGEYDLDLKSSGDGWCGTFAGLVRQAAADILSDGEPYGPVDVTWDDGEHEQVDGVLIRADNDVIEIQQESGSCIISIDDVLRFRA